MNEKTLIEKIALRILHDRDLEMENDLRKHGLRPGKASGLEGDDDGTD